MKSFSCLTMLLFTGFLGAQADAAPLLVTRTTGAVTIQADDGSKAAPSTTFALLDGQTLQLSEGATATVVSSGKAEQIIGPKTISTQSTIGSDDVAGHESSLDAIIKRQNSAANVGATRNQTDLTLTHPIPNSRIKSLDTIQWDCKSCTIDTVEVVQMQGFSSVWSTKTSSSSRKVPYTASALPPGEYAIKMNGDYYGFDVISETDQAIVSTAINEAKSLSKRLSKTDQIAIEVGILWQYGLWSDAFQTLNNALISDPQNADLVDLKRAYQASLQ